MKKAVIFVQNSKKLLALTGVLALCLLLFSACGEKEPSRAEGPSAGGSSQSVPEESGSQPGSGAESAPSPAPADTSAPAVTPTPTEGPLSTVKGEITAASKSVLSLTGADGAVTVVLLTDETEHTGESYENGNVAAVSYRESERDGQGIRAVKVDVQQGEHRSKAEELLAGLSLEEKVGQMFFVRCPDGASAEAAKYQFGGYILFGRDFDGLTKEQVQANIRSYQENSKLPMLIGADEEGGTVVRVSANPALCEEPYWSPRELYDTGGAQSVLYAEQDKCRVFRELGINVNFAPVCDIARDPGDFMYDRSLGRDPETTAGVIGQIAELYRSNEMGCVLKHFPGYGNNRDTHTGIAVDERPGGQFRQEDFLPFEAGIQAGAGCVLVSHNIVTCVDSASPASLSGKWHDVLREELGFTGCIITDDLSMGAIRDYCDTGSAAVQAVKAGNDLLCCTDYEVQLPAVTDAVQNGEITEERIDQSVLRILTWKAQLGLLDP